MALLINQKFHLDSIDDAVLYHYIETWLKKKKISTTKRKNARNRRLRQRRGWAAFQHNLTDRQFRCYSRMSRDSFMYLCQKIKENVGEEVFKSESYLLLYRGANAGNSLFSRNILIAHEESTGGFISGEVKLALTLRLLGGGSYMDLAILFDTGFTYAYQIFHEVIRKWILDDRLVKINGTEYCSDEKRMKDVALQFCNASNGLMDCCIGALDGWVVKVMRPSRRDKVRNPASFYC